MALDKVTVSNMALSHIGTRSDIESLDEASQEAGYCKLWLDVARLEALEAINWPFARTRQALAVHDDAAPAGIWQFRYQMPSNCVKMREIENIYYYSDAIPFQVELAPNGTKSILTNQDQATGIFTSNVSDYSQFPVAFSVALSRLLASYIAYSLTGRMQSAKDQYGAYIAMLRWAAAESLNEQVERKPRDVDWIRLRDSGIDAFETSTLASASGFIGTN